jgi:hypothetical protein
MERDKFTKSLDESRSEDDENNLTRMIGDWK